MTDTHRFIHDENDPSLWVEASLDPDTELPVVLVHWGTFSAAVPLDRAHVTARDMFAAANCSEVDASLVLELTETFDGDLRRVGRMMDRIRARRAHLYATTGRPVIGVEGGATIHGKPFVMLRRGSRRGQVTPAEARDMALGWTRVADIAERDHRERIILADYVEWPQIEEIMGRMARARYDEGVPSNRPERKGST